MHVCISRQQSWNCRYPVHKYSYTSNRIHGPFLFHMNYWVVFGGRLIFGVDLYSEKWSIKTYVYIHSAFAVCIVHCSLVYQFEHSGKVRRAWFKFGFENFYSSLLSGSASFLCAALMSPQRTKQYCPQIEYFAPLLHVW